MKERYYHPMIVSWELTNACNLKCKYCFNNSGKELQNELNTDETYNILRGLYNAGVFRIEFTGGEPMMRSDFENIIKYAHNMDFIISVATNGTLINKGVTGAFNRAIEGVKILKNHDIRVHIRMTATRKNIAEIEKVLLLSLDLGVDEFNVMRVWASGRAIDGQLNLNANQIINLNYEMQRIMSIYKDDINIRYDHCGFFERDAFQPYREYNERICQCGRTICTIKPDGIVTPCEVLTMKAGDLRVESFANIWKNSPVMDKFRSFNPEFLKGKCKTCLDKNICGGNCRALALIHYGDFYAEDPSCWRVLKTK